MDAHHARPPRAEIGLLLYPGCQLAMVHGMTDLLQIASNFSVERGGAALRVSHWDRQSDGDFARCQDSHPDGTGRPDILIAPARLAGPLEDEAAAYVTWLSGTVKAQRWRRSAAGPSS